MASVTKQEIPEIAAFMPELWELIKTFYIPEEGDLYWNAFNKKTSELYKKHHENNLVMHLICGFTNYLECELERRRQA